MKERQFGFEKLEVYKKARILVKDIYVVLKQFPLEERYALCDQMRRAIVSVPSNIAEGMGRFSLREQLHFLEIAYGSLLEIYCQLQIALDLDYIHEDTYKSLQTQIQELGAMIMRLRELRIVKLDSKDS